MFKLRNMSCLTMSKQIMCVWARARAGVCISVSWLYVTLNYFVHMFCIQRTAITALTVAVLPSVDTGL